VVKKHFLFLLLADDEEHSALLLPLVLSLFEQGRRFPGREGSLRDDDDVTTDKRRRQE
jgi:hypothetical protein